MKSLTQIKDWLLPGKSTALTTVDPAMRQIESNATGVSTGAITEIEQRRNAFRSIGSLKPSQLREMAKKSPTVRAAKDSIIREIAFMNWRVRHRDVDMTITPDIQKRIDEVSGLFRRVNANRKPLSYLLTSMLDDLIILDRMTMEIVYNRNGDKPVELWERDASTINPAIDINGVWTGYSQKVGNGNPYDTTPDIRFDNRQIVFCSMFPRSDSPLGNPLLETVIDQVVSLILAVKHIAVQFNEDEIPPGILWLGDGISTEILNRVRASVKQGRNRQFSDLKLRFLHGGQVSPQWIEFKRSNRDVQMAELMQAIEDTVWLTFGILPARMGRTDAVNRANLSQQADWTDNALITPIMNVLSSALTTGVIQEGYGYDDLVWELVPDREEDRKELADIAKTMIGGFPFFTINGVRKKLYNEEPWDIEAAEKPIVLLNTGEVIFLEDLKSGQIVAGGEDDTDDSSDDGGDNPDGDDSPEDEASGTEDNDIENSIFPDSNQILASLMASYDPNDTRKDWPRTAIAIDSITDPATEKAGPKNRFDLSTVEKIVPSYQTALNTAWDEAQDKIVRAIRQNAKTFQRAVQISNPEQTREAIALTLAGLVTMMDEAAFKAFSLSADNGERQASGFDPEAILPDQTKGNIVRENRQENRGFLVGGLMRDTMNNMREVTTEIYEDVEELTDAVSKAMGKELYRLAHYAEAVVAVAASVWVAGIDFTRRYEHHWVLRLDGKACEACNDAYLASPFQARGDMPFIPGNSPICKKRCRCTVRAVKRK